jgi:hypothetical protein
MQARYFIVRLCRGFIGSVIMLCLLLRWDAGCMDVLQSGQRYSFQVPAY